eukprot:m.471642 g.471642  ORF g.471642 m.471642 type:complete len:180 (-) comp21659_c0_seq3:1556-2095(-)
MVLIQWHIAMRFAQDMLVIAWFVIGIGGTCNSLLARERADTITSRREVDELRAKEQSRALQLQAEIDSAVHNLQRDTDALEHRSLHLRREKEELSKERRQLRRDLEDVENEKLKVAEYADTLQQRSAALVAQHNELQKQASTHARMKAHAEVIWHPSSDCIAAPYLPIVSHIGLLLHHV